MPKPTFYETLGVPNNAYETLSDPADRKRYDTWLKWCKPMLQDPDAKYSKAKYPDEPYHADLARARPQQQHTGGGGVKGPAQPNQPQQQQYARQPNQPPQPATEVFKVAKRRLSENRRVAWVTGYQADGYGHIIVHGANNAGTPCQVRINPNNSVTDIQGNEVNGFATTLLKKHAQSHNRSIREHVAKQTQHPTGVLKVAKLELSANGGVAYVTGYEADGHGGILVHGENNAGDHREVKINRDNSVTDAHGNEVNGFAVNELAIHAKSYTNDIRQYVAQRGRQEDQPQQQGTRASHTCGTTWGPKPGRNDDNNDHSHGSRGPGQF